MVTEPAPVLNPDFPSPDCELRRVWRPATRPSTPPCLICWRTWSQVGGGSDPKGGRGLGLACGLHTTRGMGLGEWAPLDLLTSALTLMHAAAAAYLCRPRPGGHFRCNQHHRGEEAVSGECSFNLAKHKCYRTVNPLGLPPPLLSAPQRSGTSMGSFR